MPPVQGKTSAGFPAVKFRQAYERRCINPGEAPGAVEVVLASRTVDARLGLAINPDHLVAFVPATPLVLKHGKRYSHELPVTLRFQEDVVAFSCLVLPPRIFARLGK